MSVKSSIAVNSRNHHTALSPPSKPKPRMWRQWVMLLAAVIIGGMPLLGSAKGGGDEQQGVTRVTLANGLRVVIVPNPMAPVVTTTVNYLVGSNEAPPGFPGMAHAMEHMMFRGSPGLSADQLSAIAAGVGGKFNATTRQTLTQYFYTVPAADLNVILHVEALRMRDILSSKPLWKQERGAIEQEVAADLSNPQYVLFTKVLNHMYEGTPYAHDALGTRPSFDRTTAAMLHKFHAEWYAPNNAILVIGGAVDPKQVLTEVKSLFGKIPSKKLPPRPSIKLKPVKSVTFHHTTDRPNGMVTLTLRMPGFDSPDYAAALVLGDVLNSQRAALYDLVVKGDVLNSGFQYSPLPGAGMGSAAAMIPTGQDPQPALRKLKNILADYAKNGVPADLVEAAKRRERTAVEFRKDSVSGLASVWSVALALEGRNSPQDDIDAIQKVTVDDVNRVAHTYLDLKHAVTAILTPSPSGKPVSSQEFKGEESFALSHVKGVELPRWAKNDLARLPMPESKLKPVVSTLPNGIKLIVQPTSVSDTVSLYGGIKSNPDMQMPKGKEGVDGVLAHLFSYGTTHLDRLAYQKALDDIGAEVGTGVSFYAQDLSDNFERAVELMADNELHPAMPKDAFEIVKAQAAAALKGLLQSPGYIARRTLHRALFPASDPTLREATPETVNALSLDDVRNYYQSTFRPDMPTVVVIGNITPGKARAIVEKYLGAWKAAGPKPDVLLPTVPPNKHSATRVPDKSQVQDRVALAQTVGMNRYDADYYALQLGNNVLSGGFYASRLYRDLREETGLVYYVGSAMNIGETRGVFSVNYGSDPPNVNKARTLVMRDLTALQTKPVSDEELHRAKSLVLREIALEDASLGGIAHRLLSLSMLKLPLDEPARAARMYHDMTAAQVQAAYKKWLRPGDMVQVTQGPSF
jgi:zinc protease